MDILQPTDFVFKARRYNENSTPEEIKALKRRVYIHDPHIICIKEIPIVCPFSVNLLFDVTEELSKQLGTFGLIIDLRETQRPDAISRRAISVRFKRACDNAVHASFCTGRNLLINTAARVLMYHTRLKSFSIHKGFEQSVKAIHSRIDG